MSLVNYRLLDKVNFPEFEGIAINMMPIIIGDEESIPEEYRHYASLLDACDVPDWEIGNVGYLTITESIVTEEQSQRRGGIHVESPGPNLGYGGQGRFGGGTRYSRLRRVLSWGGWGGSGLECSGCGIYMASTVSNSTAVWDACVEDPKDGGCVAHIADQLGTPITLEANQLAWMHDLTPHESLPIPAGTQRQFFRLVGSDVSVWYSLHNTANRLGVKPNAKVVTTSKF